MVAGDSVETVEGLVVVVSAVEAGVAAVGVHAAAEVVAGVPDRLPSAILKIFWLFLPFGPRTPGPFLCPEEPSSI